MIRIIDNYVDQFIRNPSKAIDTIAKAKRPIINMITTTMIQRYDRKNILKTIINLIIIFYF